MPINIDTTTFGSVYRIVYHYPLWYRNRGDTFYKIGINFKNERKFKTPINIDTTYVSSLSVFIFPKKYEE